MLREQTSSMKCSQTWAKTFTGEAKEPVENWRRQCVDFDDVVVQIVDARNPLLFRCEDLETYVKQVDPHKKVMLLINKADLLTMQQRQLWVNYFNTNGIRAVFFSAVEEKEKMEKLALTISANHDKKNKHEDTDGDFHTDDEENGEEDECIDHDDVKNETENGSRILENLKEKCLCDSFGERADLKENPNNKFNKLSDMHSEDVSDIDSNLNINQDSTLLQLENKCSKSTLESTPRTIAVENNPDIVTAGELLEVLCSFAQPSYSARVSHRRNLNPADYNEQQAEVKTVGMVGYPNVGKSSTINVILQQKKLAVSATPGRTKHLQTLYVDSGLMLCDCPGLVFPSFVATKAHLVINGILPIDELRDHISPVNLISFLSKYGSFTNCFFKNA
ncbi:large subunit GTPase 1 [Plakobranchus ocellatus]|uniref:Large subunit GTPase 1 homolog n=1 Tax=Plakobranchus ocellatus TaxID=259542 RepID=A0AAV4A1G2_9GAST|nr:large subunit GTPase 1 [Plakobranchus ocellatus]